MRVAGTIAHLIAVLVIGIADYASGPDIQFSVIYTVPIVTAALWLGGVPAVIVALAGAASWFWNQEFSVAHSYSVYVSAWNGLSRAMIYTLVAVAIARIRRDQLELRRLDRLRDEFLALIAHELRQPAVAMALASEGLSSSTDLDASARRMLVGLRDQSRGLAQLADQLLAIGQLEAGQLKLNRIRFDVSALAREATRELPDAGRIDLDLPASPTYVLGDPARFRQVIDNLVSNAIKYSPPTARVAIRVRDDRDTVSLEVVDAGMGFRPTESKSLFQKYSRLESARANNVDGAGLGLYLTRLLVDAHGGTVAAWSAGMGRGAKFTVRLPAGAAA